jgi:hypothetical protein
LKRIELRHTCEFLPYRKRLGGGGVKVCSVAPVHPHPPPGNENLF